MTEVTDFTHVPSFDGQASSFANYEEKAILWNQIPTLDARKRAANLLSHMADIARKVSMGVSKDFIGNNDGVRQVLRILLERQAPDAIDAICQEVAKFMNFERTDQTTDAYLMEFDVSREAADARMVEESGPPDEFAPILRMQDAALALQYSSASIRKTPESMKEPLA